MKFKKILLLSKQNSEKFSSLGSSSSDNRLLEGILKGNQRAYQSSNDDHRLTLKFVKGVLRQKNFNFDVKYRDGSINYRLYDLIITIGGDGTFLEAARHMSGQPIFGVNSAINHSVGRFCIANIHNFEKVFNDVLSGNIKSAKLSRLQIEINGQKQPMEALNDILICHHNPAFLCRYYIQVGRIGEQQRSSGVWISTPAGSSGAVHSAGGKILDPYQKKMQYMPRELYCGTDLKYVLEGGVLAYRQTLKIISLMRQGMIYLDGAHYHIPFSYGTIASISTSPHPVKTFHV